MTAFGAGTKGRATPTEEVPTTIVEVMETPAGGPTTAVRKTTAGGMGGMGGMGTDSTDGTGAGMGDMMATMSAGDPGMNPPDPTPGTPGSTSTTPYSPMIALFDGNDPGVVDAQYSARSTA